ncbi:unnamed protein product [Closterium sp. NIES-53]
MRRGGQYPKRLREFPTTRYGSYEFTLIFKPPSTFQLTMNWVFCDLLEKCVIFYLDNILFFSKTRDEHLRVLDAVIKCLQDNCLITKCDLFKWELDILGHIISHDGIKIDLAKINVIQEWKSPTNVTELQSFLGFVDYVRRFIPNMAGITGLLIDLQHKDRNFAWGKEAKASFQELKKKFCYSLRFCASPTHPSLLKTSPMPHILPSVLYSSRILAMVHNQLPTSHASYRQPSATTRTMTRKYSPLSTHSSFGAAT